MLGLKKSQYPIFAINILMLLCFGTYYVVTGNKEFIIFVVVIIGVLALLVYTNRKVQYSNVALWGLTIWAFLHMAGGVFYIGGTRLYELILIPIVDSGEYQVLRYDQAIHAFAFGVTTLIMFELIRPLLGKRINKWVALSIVVVMAGLGVGALNEIIEFFISLASTEAKIGGYENTSMDLVADLVGAVLAMVMIVVREKRKGDKEEKGKKKKKPEKSDD
jgi:putative membrane protein